VVALLLSLAGVDRKVIAEDYALSETMLEPANLTWLEEQSRIQGRPVERPHWMFSPPEKMEGLFEYLDKEYGGVEGYLEAAGVTREEMERIREGLVEREDE
jgi:protein-tyrosine phosphatase